MHWYKARGKWRAKIEHNGKKRHLGYFASIDDASAAYETAARELHGEFARNENGPIPVDDDETRH